jgi:hypothetical protein
LASAIYAETYPKVDISGYKKWEYKNASVDPAANYFLGLTHLGGFTPFSTGPWQERLKLKVQAQLHEKLAVSYDIEQQPEAPDKYNVKLTYDDKHELTFGDFNAEFSGNEFASTTKVLNGMMITSRDQDYNLMFIPSAKFKSQTQPLTKQNGRNAKGPYSLGHGSIIEGTERIQLNGAALERNKDYIINYLDGTVTFTRIIFSTDEFAYSYDYTNVADLFGPIISQKDFMGFQGRVKIDPYSWTQRRPKAKPAVDSAAETFPKGEGEEEEIGHYQLKNHPVVRFSEVLTYQGKILTKDKDYVIKYEEGKIDLLLSSLPRREDPLSVSYNYRKTEAVEEILPGEGSRGPYVLANQNLVPQSEEITIDHRALSGNFDYMIDYESGRIIFNFTVPNTSAIKVKYQYASFELPPPPPPPKIAQQLTLGASYLKESAKPGVGEFTANYSEPAIKASDIIANDQTIYLSHYPLVPTSEGGTFVLTAGGIDLVYGVDYMIPTVEADPSTGRARTIPPTRLAYLNDRMDFTDGWDTGTVKILTTLEATAEVQATYTYRKSVFGRYAGAGSGSRGPYYISNYRNIIPGTEKVEVWETGTKNAVTYTRNSSFEPDAGNTGYSINYYKENPYLTFNQELFPDQSFSVTFQYAPPVPAVGNIAQELTGFDAGYKLGDLLELKTDYAFSKTGKVTATVSTVETFVFTAPASKVRVRTNVRENSEKVYINNYLRNRDIDYAIDYTSGNIVFYYITLNAGDTVTVDYQYYDPGGIIQASEKVGHARKYEAKSTLGALTMAYLDRSIDHDFNPLGGTVIGIGSRYKDFSAAFAPNFHGLNLGTAYRETADPLPGSRESFTREYDRRYSLGINPFAMADMSLSLRNYEKKGDLSTADSQQNEYAGSLTPRELRFWLLSYRQKYDGKLIDARDLLQKSFARNKYFHTSQGVGLPRINAGADFEYSDNYTLSDYQTTLEARSNWETVKDLAYDLSLDLTARPVQRWTAYAKLINHESLTQAPASTRLETRNITYRTELVPIRILNLRYERNRQETPSVLVAGKNPMNEKSTSNVSLTPFSNFSTGWEHTENADVHDTGKESSGLSNTYSAKWTIISTQVIRLDSVFSQQDIASTAPSGTWDAVRSDQNIFTQDYNLFLTPNPVLSIAPGFTQVDYKNETWGQTPLEARSQTARINLTCKPLPRLSASGNYDLKVTSTSTLSPREKRTLNLQAGYKVLDWGEAVYSYDHEHNEGEVVAGGTIPNINYTKISRALGFNFGIPQDNPILSAIVLGLSYKVVTFENHLNAGEDLTASLLSFEGTLSF